MNVLEEICDRKRTHIAQCLNKTPLEDIKKAAQSAPAPRGFKNALIQKHENDEIALIAEVKKASPSKGLIRDNFVPQDIAKQYQNAGAACISVLTDEPYFQGHDTYLRQVHEAVSIPLLRKDFMVDPYQIYESRALGADCILLIMAAISDEDAMEMYSIARDLGMDVLVETHDADEIERALRFEESLIGVNSRNLKTLDVSLNTAKTLIEKIPDSFFKIAESGIYTPGDIEDLKVSGYHGFLIGESLMRQDDIEAATRKILLKD